MKFLHLADLHLGKILHEQSLIEDQKYMISKIEEKIEKEDIDAVIIAGDVYDKSLPTTDAVNLLDSFLNILIKKLKVKVFIISGNHDSKDRLGFGNKIFENDGLYISSKYDGQLKKIQLEDKYGKINIYMLPYIKPAEVRKYFNKEINSYNQAVEEIIRKEEINEKERNIIIVHQFITFGKISPKRTESETISVGGIDNVDISNFDKFDFVAIGHIHKSQRIGRDTARYAGTMLKYSFSEVNDNKSIPVIEFKEKGNIDIDLQEIKPIRDLREIKGPLEELLKEENYKGTNQNDYIKAVLTNEEPLYDPIGQLRKIYPNILKLEIKNSKTIDQAEFNENSLEQLKKKTELELFNDFYKMQNNVELNEEQIDIISKIIKEVKNEAD